MRRGYGEWWGAREEPAAAVYGGEIAHGRSAQLHDDVGRCGARARGGDASQDSSARPLGPLACREDDARRRARPRPDARCALALGPARHVRPATCYVCVVERDLRIETRWRCLLRRYRDRQYMLLSSFSHTHKSCSGCSLSRGSTALESRSVSDVLWSLVPGRGRDVNMCAIICSRMDSHMSVRPICSSL